MNSILYISSFFILILAFYLSTIGNIKISILYFLLFITSINHWSSPTYGIKRNMDLVMVFITTIVSIIYMSEEWLYHFIVMYTLFLFYLSYYFQSKDYILTSTLLHSKIHLTCLVGNAYFYSIS